MTALLGGYLVAGVGGSEGLQVLRERGETVRDEKGYVLVMAALMGACLMGVAALALDAGRGYLARMELQDAVDAAALAGVAELPGDPVAAEQVAHAYASRHGLDPGQVEVDVMTASEARGEAPAPGEPPSVIRVTAAADPGTTFARIWSVEHMPVGARAEASVAPLGGARGVVPLGVGEEDFVVGERYALKLAGGSGEHGNFHALALGGRGARNYEERLAEGWQQMVRVGDRLETEPGNMSGPTGWAIEERLARARPGETFTDYAPNSPRLLLLPVVDFSGVHGRDEVTVVGFAYFFLEEYTGEGSESWVYGRFLRRATAGELGAWEGAASWRALGVKLTR